MPGTPRGSHFKNELSLGSLLLLTCLCGWPMSSARAGETSDTVQPAESPAKTLAALVEEPSLALLRQLLSASGAEELEPGKLLERVADSRGNKFGPAWRIPTDEGTIVAVIADVRPREVEDPRFLMGGTPRAAFLFDEAGKLVAQLGGQFSPTGAPDYVDVVNLGPLENWFIRIERFEKNPPFDFRTEFYRVATRPIPSLRYLHYPNSHAWSYGPLPESRYGKLYLKMTGIDLPDQCGGVLGTTENNILMPREIIWDADNERFRGAVTQSVNGRAAYQVDIKWSREFEPLHRKSNQLLAIGGARGSESFYDWQIMVPHETAAIVTLMLPDPADKSASKVVSKTLRPGLHMVSLVVKPAADGQRTDLNLHVDQEPKQDFRVAAVPADDQSDAPPVIQMIEPSGNARLFEIVLEQCKLPLTLTVSLPE